MGSPNEKKALGVKVSPISITSLVPTCKSSDLVQVKKENAAIIKVDGNDVSDLINLCCAAGLVKTLTTGQLDNVIAKVRKFSNELTMVKAIEGGTQISSLNRIDKTLTLRTICFILRDFLSSFKRKREFETDREIIRCASTIAEEFKQMKIEEIAFALRLARVGRLGPVLDTIDEFTVISFIRKYETSEEKSIYWETRNKSLQKSRDTWPIDPKERKQAIKSFYEEGLKYQEELKKIQVEKKKQEADIRKARNLDYAKKLQNQRKAEKFCYNALSEEERLIVDMAQRFGTENFNTEELAIFNDYKNNVRISLYG